MSCNHDIITNIIVDDKYVLVHCNGVLITGGLITGNVSSAHEVEVFDDVQSLVNRAEDLGVQCTDLDLLILILEYYGVLPTDHMNYVLDNVWDADIDFQERMIAIGYTKP